MNVVLDIAVLTLVAGSVFVLIGYLAWPQEVRSSRP